MKKYSVIYADPPWSYYNDMTVHPEFNKSGDGSISRLTYPVMSSSDIAALSVGQIAAKDSVLLIWTTDYHLSRCCEVIRSWGFEYKTVGFAWQKLNKQGQPVCFMGSYTLKSGIELCLLATRGDASKLLLNRKIRALISSQREAHSKKPDEVRKRIDQLFGDVAKIELFARARHQGWDAWGNEVESDIIL